VSNYDEESPLVKALEERQKNRATWDFEATNMMGPGGKSLGAYKIWVASKAEQDAAVVNAHKYAEELGGKDTPASKDADILTEAKTAHILHTCCRHHAKPQALAAFPSPKWMMQHMSTDELGVLLNNYNACLGESGVFEMDTSEERVEFYISLCAEAGYTDLPDMALAQCHRDYLIYLLVCCAKKLRRAEKQPNALSSLHERPDEDAAPHGEGADTP